MLTLHRASRRVLPACIGVILLSFGTALADPIPPSTLVYSSVVNDQITTRSAPADPRNSVRFTAVYHDPTAPGPDQNVEMSDGETVFTDTPIGLDHMFTATNVLNEVKLYADPLTLRVKSLNTAWSTAGEHAFVHTAAGVARWFVLRGARGPVSLRADIAVRGTVYGDVSAGDGHATAFFSHTLGVLTDPLGLTTAYPLVVNGAAQPAGAPCGGFGLTGTVPDQCFVSDGTAHLVSRVVRSNPFTVMPNVPYRLVLTVTAATATAGLVPVKAYAEFDDPGLASAADFPGVPGLTPEGFVVDLDGDPRTQDAATLSSLGYSVEPIPDLMALSPATFWIGLKSREDQGANFDLRAEVYAGRQLIAAGEAPCVTGLSSDPPSATRVSVPLRLVPGAGLEPGATLSLKVSTRIGTTPAGHKCETTGGSRDSAAGLRLYHDGEQRPAQLAVRRQGQPPIELFLHSLGNARVLDGNAPTGAPAVEDSGGVRFSKRNAWQTIGIWRAAGVRP